LAIHAQKRIRILPKPKVHTQSAIAIGFHARKEKKIRNVHFRVYQNCFLEFVDENEKKPKRKIIL
jgi:hypothetical protein